MVGGTSERRAPREPSGQSGLPRRQPDTRGVTAFGDHHRTLITQRRARPFRHVTALDARTVHGRTKATADSTASRGLAKTGVVIVSAVTASAIDACANTITSTEPSTKAQLAPTALR
jgi:hypothetical protein